MNPKQVAGRRAAAFAESSMRLGLGTGSTVWFALVALAERLAAGELVDVVGVPTSLDTERKARDLGLPLVDLADVERLDLTIDGADEIDADFRMIKGGGGALLREKVVASITQRMVVVVGADKVVERLGRAFPLPVEVVPFAVPVVARSLERLGCRPTLRGGAREPFVTDNSNHILDCAFDQGIADAPATESAIALLPGVVECGLFIGLAHTLVIGREDGGCEVREAPRA